MRAINSQMFPTLPRCQVLEYRKKPLLHSICKAGKAQARNPCEHLMNEGVNDRKCGVASNLACAVTKQASLHTCMCAHSGVCTWGLYEGPEGQLRWLCAYLTPACDGSRARDCAKHKD